MFFSAFSMKTMIFQQWNFWLKQCMYVYVYLLKKISINNFLEKW
jgi:hypothetical protein